MKRIYKVKFIDDGDDRTMEAALRGIRRTKENLRRKTESLQESIPVSDEPIINLPAEPVVRGILRRVFVGRVGTATSGHRGHKGRPGHRGGSLPGPDTYKPSKPSPSPWRGRVMPDAVADRFYAGYNSESALQSPEVGEIVTDKGGVQFRKVGGEDYIQYSDEELKRYMNNRRVWLLHNHPGGSSLSEEDILMGFINGLDGIAAVGRDGGQLRVFSMAFDRETITHAIQVSGLSRRQWGAMVVGNAMSQVNSELRYIYQPQVTAGIMTEEEASRRHMADRLRIFDDRPDVGHLISTETLEVAG